MFGYSMGPSRVENYDLWVQIYGLIIAFIVLGVVALAFVLNASVFNKSKENQLSGGMKSMFNLFSLKGHVFESLLKVTTLSIITYNVLMIPVGFNAGFMAGFISMVSTLILGVLGVYVAGMALMMLYRVFVTVSEINARDKGVAFDPENPYGLVKPVAPVQQPYYGAPVQQPYYGAPVQQPYYGAPYGAPVKPANTFFNDLLNVIVTFFKKPAEAKTLAIKNGNLLIPGVLLGVYAFFTMIVTWLSFNSITLSTWRAVKEAYGDYLSESGMKYGKITKEIFNVPGLLFAGLLTAAVFVGILLLIRFTMSKIAGSNEGDLKSGLVVVSLYSIPATALVFLACICSFFSLGLCLILSALASLFMLVSVLTDTARINATQLESGKWLFIFPAVVIIALVLNALLGSLFIKIGLSEQVREVIDGMGKLITDPSSVFEGIM